MSDRRLRDRGVVDYREVDSDGDFSETDGEGSGYATAHDSSFSSTHHDSSFDRTVIDADLPAGIEAELDADDPSRTAVDANRPP